MKNYLLYLKILGLFIKLGVTVFSLYQAYALYNSGRLTDALLVLMLLELAAIRQGMETK